MVEEIKGKTELKCTAFLDLVNTLDTKYWPRREDWFPNEDELKMLMDIVPMLEESAKKCKDTRELDTHILNLKSRNEWFKDKVREYRKIYEEMGGEWDKYRFID